MGLLKGTALVLTELERCGTGKGNGDAQAGFYCVLCSSRPVTGFQPFRSEKAKEKIGEKIVPGHQEYTCLKNNEQT